MTKRTLESSIRLGRQDFYSEVPEIKRIADQVKVFLAEVILPFITSNDPAVKATACEIYERFENGLKDEFNYHAKTVNGPASKEEL